MRCVKSACCIPQSSFKSLGLGAFGKGEYLECSIWPEGLLVWMLSSISDEMPEPLKGWVRERRGGEEERRGEEAGEDIKREEGERR